MRKFTHTQAPLWVSASRLAVVGLLLAAVGCQSPHQPTVRTEPYVGPGWPKPDNFFTQVAYHEARATVPTIQGAEYVNDNEICANCHGAYAKAFTESNVHRGEGCEACHGPASKHVETRGKEPGLIFSFKTGPNISGVVLAEACLVCHEQNACAEGNRWRTSKHAQCGVTCVSCHRGHYNVPAGTPATTGPGVASQPHTVLASYHAPAPEARKKPANADKLPSLRGSSQHMGAVASYLCYRCHGDKTDLQRIASPHQICGPNGFNCTTCHDPHGHLKESSRRDLCLSCHKDAPTMAWHSSIHELNGVACTDCHNPHPCSRVPQFVNISHYQVERPKRMPMSVQEPEACYKCHPKIFALNRLPSHHPIMEGKMVCSDCHDPHGQLERNLKAENINQLCYKCHMEKQGPFAYPHAPVTENCDICHEPHGTVANNLLRQPPTFLCLRCHVGHRRLASHPSVPAANIDVSPNLRQPLYTNCTQCHTQIHGTDVPSPGEPNAAVLFR